MPTRHKKTYQTNKDNKNLTTMNFDYIICSLTTPQPKKTEGSFGILSSNASIYYSNTFKIDPHINNKLSIFNIDKYLVFLITKDDLVEKNRIRLNRPFIDEESENLIYAYIGLSDFFSYDLINFAFFNYKLEDSLKNAHVIFIFTEIT